MWVSNSHTFKIAVNFVIVFQQVCQVWIWISASLPLGTSHQSPLVFSYRGYSWQYLHKVNQKCLMIFIRTLNSSGTSKQALLICLICEFTCKTEETTCSSYANLHPFINRDVLDYLLGVGLHTRHPAPAEWKQVSLKGGCGRGGLPDR